MQLKEQDYKKKDMENGTTWFRRSGGVEGELVVAMEASTFHILVQVHEFGVCEYIN